MLQLQIQKLRDRRQLLAQGLSEDAVQRALRQSVNEFRPAFVNGRRRQGGESQPPQKPAESAYLDGSLARQD